MVLGNFYGIFTFFQPKNMSYKIEKNHLILLASAKFNLISKSYNKLQVHF